MALFLLLAGALSAAEPGAAAAGRTVAGPPVPDLPPVGPAVFRMPTLLPRPAGWLPAAPAGFRVEPFATDLDGPRRLLPLPNGDVLVAQARTERMDGLPEAVVAALTRQQIFGPSANEVLLLRPAAGRVERHVLLRGLNQPFGLLLLGEWLWVANTDALLRFRFRAGDTRVQGAGEKVLDLPAGPVNNHWTRNLLASADGSRIWVTVGAASNVNERGTDPPDRAAIWEVDAATGAHRVLATGLRNPTGLALDPSTGALWTTVNERDGLGEDVPPDYLARVVDGAFYGWPYVYFGTHPDPTWQRLDPARVADAQRRARVPELALGGHSVPLGIVFRRGPAWPAPWAQGAFVARRGGGGRVRYLGYDVAFVPFARGAPTGAVEPFLTGFVASYERGEVYGRPVDVAEAGDGALLVSDDGANVIWRVSRAR
jgi:glucose/arabinose dehydrogenase